jgi:malate dehydrogenase (oxaloacetate-decarboxylating)
VTADELNANYIIPSVFHADVHTRVANAVRGAAERSSKVPTSDV